MARPKSTTRHEAILSASVLVIARQGLSAPTAAIAKQAHISNGSLFTYFETKADLFNALYVELKQEMATAALDGLPAGSGPREQFFHVWSQWLNWAIGNPERRRTLARLTVCDDITPASHKAGAAALGDLVRIVDRARSDGPMRDAPLILVMTLLNGAAEATMDLMMRDPARASSHSIMAFDAMWRAIA